MARTLFLQLFPCPTQTCLKTSIPFQFPSLRTHRANPNLPLHLRPASILRKDRLALCSISSSSSSGPPSSREEAISQAKICLSTTLHKSLNNSPLVPTRKLKKLRHPRYRVEVPVADDSPASLTQLALDFFSDLPLRKKKASNARALILWSSSSVAESARQAFVLSDVVNSDWGSLIPESLSSVDLAVYMAPDVSLMEDMKRVTKYLYPKPVVLFNPKWGFEEEKDLGKDSESFVSSFDVVYSFMGLEVRGVLNKRRGVVFKCARDGVVSGEWAVMVEGDGTNKDELKTVASFKRRPSISEVEFLLYNQMAANSPVTKSVKFFSELVSNVTGRKQKNRLSIIHNLVESYTTHCL